jgi:putative acetyltransferase
VGVFVVLRIVPYHSSWLPRLISLFSRAVHAIPVQHYSNKQKDAWAPKDLDQNRWEKKLQSVRPYLALVDEKLLGFMSMDEDGYIDLMYVDPDFQRKGVGKALFDYLRRSAFKRNIPSMSTYASKVARPFFEQMGFAVVQENQVELRGETLTTFTMRKALTHTSPSLLPQ